MKKKRLLIYFCISLALLTLLGVSFFYLRKLNALEKNSIRVDHSYQVIIQTNLLEQNLLNAETSQRGYLLTENSDFLEAYVTELKDIPKILSKLDSLTADNREQQDNLDTLREAINIQVRFLKATMTGTAYGDSIPLKMFRESGIYMNKIRYIITTIKNEESYLLSEHSYDKTKDSRESKKSSLLSLIIGFVLCCIASVSIIWFFNRNENYQTNLEDQLSKLTILNAEVKGLIMASAHNLQEPMRKVQLIIDWLQHSQGVEDLPLDGQLNRIKEIYNRQQITNNKIVDYYNILLNSGEKEKIDLHEFLTQLQLKNKWNSNFLLKLDALKPIIGNPDQLELLFTNLINNAWQFRDPTRDLSVHIRLGSDKEMAVAFPKLKHRHYSCIAVSDNGIGLQKEYSSKIFDLFQKGDVSPGNATHSGMGLSFCKRILLNHGGAISAVNNEPTGLTILLFFPQS